MHLEIDLLSENHWYELFFCASILFAALCFLHRTRKQGIPLHLALTLYGIAVVCFLLGAKLSTISFSEWQFALSNSSFPLTEKKSVIGGIIGVLIGIPVFKKLMGYNAPILDAFAVSFPIAMALQRIGCFYAGCCYGTPTDGFLSVTYSLNETEQILALHPNQLYQVVACLIIALAIYKYGRVFKRANNRFYASVTLYAIARFFLEFTRDSSLVTGFTAEQLFGLKILQWVLLGVVIVSTVFILCREKNCRQEANQEARAHTTGIIALTLLSITLLNWLGAFEALLTISFTGVAAIASLHNYLAARKSVWRAQWLMACSVLLLPIGTLTAQKAYLELTADSNSRNSFTDIRLEFGQFDYQHYHQAPTVGQNSCGTTLVTNGPIYKHQSYGFAGGVTHTVTRGQFQQSIFKGTITGGWDIDVDTMVNRTNGVFDLHLSESYDFKWVGGGFGFHFSNGMSENNTMGVIWSASDATTGSGSLSGHLRVLPIHIVYLEGGFNETTPYLSAHRQQSAFRFGIGSGLGFRNGTFFEFGVDGNTHYYVKAKYLLKEKFSFYATWAVTQSRFPNYWQFGFGYRVKQKHWYE